MRAVMSRQNKYDVSEPIAWIVSIGAHLGIGVLAFFVTWSVIRSKDAPPRVVTASWHEKPMQESASLPLALLPTPEALPPTLGALLEIPQMPAIQTPSTSVKDGLAILHETTQGSPLPELARREPAIEVQFMGPNAFAARRIVYVVDASGPMQQWLGDVFIELERSLRALDPKQEFGIVFFQHGKAIVVPPKGALASANAANITAAMRWMRNDGNVIGTGATTPIIGIEEAIGLTPDVIYVLSEDITGSGDYEVTTSEVLEKLDALNPIGSRDGLRKVQINCIQFLTYNKLTPTRRDDPNIMQRIAEIHGGEDGYTHISLVE